jgi:hypothetical protein
MVAIWKSAGISCISQKPIRLIKFSSQNSNAITTITILTAAALKATAAGIGMWFRVTVIDLGRQLHWSYLPPLMVYLAAGISSLTAIVGTFFVKDYLSLSAAFWAGIPWALKMPLGHLVDFIWRWKALLVWLGAGLIAASVAIMYGLIARTEAMTAIMSADAWYVLASPGYARPPRKLASPKPKPSPATLLERIRARRAKRRARWGH